MHSTKYTKYGLLNVLYKVKIQTFRIRADTIWYILEELGTRIVMSCQTGDFHNELVEGSHSRIGTLGFKSYPQSCKHFLAIQGIARGEETKQLSVSSAAAKKKKNQTLQTDNPSFHKCTKS